MSRFRSLLVALTAASLSLHLVVMTGAALVAFSSGAALSDIICTCAHGDDHESCPMHGTPKDSTRCRLQSAQNDLGIALMSVLGPMPRTTSYPGVVDAPAPGPIGYAPAWPSNWFVPPEPPPPRR